MVADGVLRGVQINRDDPTDRLLKAYMLTNINADIYDVYIRSMPPSADTIAMVGDMVKARYPYIDNEKVARAEEVERYNMLMARANKLLRSKGNKHG